MKINKLLTTKKNTYKRTYKFFTNKYIINYQQTSHINNKIFEYTFLSDMNLILTD